MTAKCVIPRILTDSPESVLEKGLFPTSIGDFRTFLSDDFLIERYFCLIVPIPEFYFWLFSKNLFSYRIFCAIMELSDKRAVEMTNFKTVCFTGHRQIYAFEKQALSNALHMEIERQIRAGARLFRTGGALGFDTMAAQAVLKLREKHSDVQLELILPCPSQDARWQPQDRQIYKQILEQADRIQYIGSQYFNGILQLRNRQLVQGADVCIAYLKSSHGGGTAYTSALALRLGLEFINLADRQPGSPVF